MNRDYREPHRKSGRARRKSGRGDRQTDTGKHYGGNFQASQYRGVSYDRRDGRRKRWIAKLSKLRVHHLCATEDEAAHVVNLCHCVAFPEKFARQGYVNDTGLYSRSASYDGDGRPAQWVNSPEHPDGYFVRLDPADVAPVALRIGWFHSGRAAFPRTPYLVADGDGRVRVRWITLDTFLTGYECLPRDGDFRNARRGNLMPVVRSEHTPFAERSGPAGECPQRRLLREADYYEEEESGAGQRAPEAVQAARGAAVSPAPAPPPGDPHGGLRCD